MILRTNKILPTSLPTNSLCLNAIGVQSAGVSTSISGHDAIADENGFYIVDENNNYIND